MPTPHTESAGPPRRRRHDRTARDQAADSTRQRILDAAVAEFGAKGYAGARTAGIAARAGVNQQLIAYYFGGKQGLLDELRRRWAARQDALVPAGTSYPDALRAYLDATLDDPDWARLVLWQALGDVPGDGDSGDSGGHAERTMSDAPGSPDAFAGQRDRIADGVRRIRQRQADGELTDAVSPDFVLLLSFMAAFAPLVLPAPLRAVLDVAPDSADYRERCVEQLSTLLRPR
jgi:TetR/AcrR family transcriptional regulator